MRHRRAALFTGAALWASPALCADALNYGAPPQWVVPQAIPASKTTDAPYALLLDDQQFALESGKTVTYLEMAVRIQNP